MVAPAGAPIGHADQLLIRQRFFYSGGSGQATLLLGLRPDFIRSTPPEGAIPFGIRCLPGIPTFALSLFR